MIREKAYAKLNLNLHILPDLKFKKKTGYYSIQFINCELDLHDDLYFENQKNKITFICDNKELSNNENLVYKAAFLLKKEIGNPNLGVKIFLQKRIPIKAGLGGGSSNAAAVIKGLLKLWKVTLRPIQITKIINLLGSDIFYFMQGGLCEVLGKGDHVIKLPNILQKLWMVLIIPAISKPSTSWMYKNINVNMTGLNLDKIEQFKNKIINKKKVEILNSLHNDFEDMIAVQYPDLEIIKQDLKNSGSIKDIIAGSGLTVAGFYPTRQMALEAFTSLQSKYKNILWTHTK